MTADLFDNLPGPGPREETLAEGAVLLRGFAGDVAATLMTEVDRVTAVAPFRHLVTPGGYLMSVAMTNCGAVGWVSDRTGYRYDPEDPINERPWPPMPAAFLDLAARAAARAGFDGFVPDACLINRYEPGTRLSLHQDRDERDTGAPIVSVSLGLPATFLFGGLQRGDPTRKVRVEHGDVAVWGGPARLAFHGVAPLPDGSHAILGRQRINLTFRKAQ
jgi:alkylated DNA repair protein (DNA oxidative demethylase)